MSHPTTARPARRPPLRLWPAVILVVIQWSALHLLAKAVPETAMWAVLGGLACGPAILLWWMVFSRAPRAERWGALALIVAAMVLTPRFLHLSVARGNMGFQYYLLAVPLLSLCFVAWALVADRLSPGSRRAAMVVAILLGCGVWTLVRSEGLTGDGMAELTWRWSKTAEERLLASAADTPAAGEAAPSPSLAVAEPATRGPGPAPDAAATEPSDAAVVEPSPEAADVPPQDPGTAVTAVVGFDGSLHEAPSPSAGGTTLPAAAGPGFRGPRRDGVITGARLATDWRASPPLELWRRDIGPGVSSIAADGDLLYTQEQRGEEEIVACYRASTGEPVWMHHDTTRFWDPHVGAGPRATPAVADGRVYTLGATGILNALDAADGSLVWSRDVASDGAVEQPTWGFVSSPLVVGELVVAAAGRLLAYGATTGELLWLGPETGGSYSSPHLLTLGGVPQVVLLTHKGVTSVALADGAPLWTHDWPGIGMSQPAPTGDGDLLISMADGSASPIGTRRLAVTNEPGGWSVEARWTSTGLKPSFSPLVVHRGHAYGFDGAILACIDLADGERRWKGGRYGHGQLVLLPEQELLLVLTERGGVALVEATPEGFRELARFAAIEGRTWSQPTLDGDLLVVRNGQEMAAFRLPRGSD